MTNMQMWAIIVGALTPPFLAFVQQPQWSGLVRSTVMVAGAAVDGIITVALSDTINWHNYAQAALMCGVAVVAAYEGFFKPSGIAPHIESQTVVRSNRTDA